MMLERWDWRRRRHGLQAAPQVIFKDESEELAKGLARVNEERRAKREEREGYE